MRIRPLTITTLGVVLVIGSLIFFQINVGSSTVVAIRDIGVLEDTAYATIILVLVGLTMAFAGITRYLQIMPSKGGTRNRAWKLERLSFAIAHRGSAKIFLLSSVGYGLIFGVVSSTLVFQPGLAFSEVYGVKVPSLVPVLCCGTFGQMPQLVFYATQQLAILVIPANIVLLFVVSWLVGLNAGIANFAYASRPQLAGARWISGLGAIVGLFTICPTCAGFFLLATLGVSGAVALALTLSSLQAVFIGIGIPILAVTPILMIRRIPATVTCSVAKQNQA